MVRSSLWAKSLPALGVLLALVLAALAVALWLDGRTDTGSDSGLGRAMATAQAARVEARAAMTGDSTTIAALDSSRTRLEQALAAARTGGTTPASSELLSAPEWASMSNALAAIVESGENLRKFHEERARVLERAPNLLSATANFAGTLPPEDLRANQNHLERLELAVETLQQNARALATPANNADSLQRMGDTVESLGEILGGLSGSDASLGIRAVSDATAVRNLAAVNGLFEEMRATTGALAAAAPGVGRAEAALVELDNAGATLLTAYDSVEVAPASAVALPWIGRLPLLLAAAAVLLMVLIGLAYGRARDSRRAADLQAEQSERDQQAILRLLDELSSLADGDLTVEATVTEDITGAIAAQARHDGQRIIHPGRRRGQANRVDGAAPRALRGAAGQTSGSGLGLRGKNGHLRRGSFRQRRALRRRCPACRRCCS
jgi:twitching motility protein PilJ